MEASSTLAVLQAAERLRAAGHEVIDLGAGEPDFPTPENIKDAARRALAENFTKYTPAAGIADLKTAISGYLNDRFGSAYTPKQVIVTTGGKMAIFHAVVTLIDPDDEVLIPSPYWVTFPQIVTFAGGRNVFIPTEENGFQLTAEMLGDSLRSLRRAKLLILNSPCNPTGAVIPFGEFQRIIEKAVEHGLYVIADECYREFVYSPLEPTSAAALPRELHDRVLLAGSLSKTYAMTGWRIGYAVGAEAWTNEMIKVQSHSTSNPTSIAQKAAVEALAGSQESVSLMLEEYQRRRDFIVPALDGIPGFACTMPEGAFYAFPNVKGIMSKLGLKSCKDVELRLLEECHIALTAGSAFGVEGYLRISYANSMAALERAIERLKKFAQEAI
jgi:aspartate aminotransferase